MLKARTVGTVLCLGALTVLPACSMFGGDSGSSQYRQSAYNNTAPAPMAGSSVNGDAAVTPGMIRDVQTKLQQANLYRGQVDGVWGPRTERGVHDWQQANNLTVSGRLDMATLQAMNVSADNNQSGQNTSAASDNAAAQNAAAVQNANAAQPNYSTAGTRPTGNSYSNNTTVPTSTSTPAGTPTSPAMAPGNNGYSGNSTAPTSR